MGFKVVTLEIGEYYNVNGRTCRFEKSTVKGYNFFDFISGRKIFKKHIYRYNGNDSRYVFPPDVFVKETENPFNNPVLVKAREEYRESHMTPEIRSQIAIKVDEQGNVIYK